MKNFKKTLSLLIASAALSYSAASSAMNLKSNTSMSDDEAKAITQAILVNNGAETQTSDLNEKVIGMSLLHPLISIQVLGFKLGNMDAAPNGHRTFLRNVIISTSQSKNRVQCNLVVNTSGSVVLDSTSLDSCLDVETNVSFGFNVKKVSEGKEYSEQRSSLNLNPNYVVELH